MQVEAPRGQCEVTKKEKLGVSAHLKAAAVFRLSSRDRARPPLTYELTMLTTNQACNLTVRLFTRTVCGLLLFATFPHFASAFTFSTEFDNASDFDNFIFYNEEVFFDDDMDGLDEFGLPNPNATPEVLTPDGEWIFLPDEPEPALDEEPKPGGGTGVLRLETGLTHVDSPREARGGAGDNAALIHVPGATGQSASASTTWTQHPRHSFENNTFFGLALFVNQPYTTHGYARELSNGKMFPDDYPADVVDQDDAEFYDLQISTRSSTFAVVKRAFDENGVMQSTVLGDVVDLDPDASTRARFDLAELSIEGTPARENEVTFSAVRTMVPDGQGGMIEGIQFDVTYGVWYGNVNENEGVQPEFIEETFTRYDSTGDLLSGEYFGIREQRYDPGAGNWFYDFLDFELEVDAVATSVPGDFNGDGMVDLSDYVVWRDNLGAATENALNGGGDQMNGVDTGDYDLWKQQFGAGQSSASATQAVPEPAAASFAALLALAACLRLRNRL